MMLDHAKILGWAANDNLGKYYDALVDTSGDGIADLITGPWVESHQWGVMNGPFIEGESTVELDAWLEGTEGGWLHPIGDVDGDGIGDVVSHYGLHHGPLQGELTSDDAVLILTDSGSTVGGSGIISGGAGDVSGDGLWDFIASYAAYDPDGYLGATAQPGQAYLFLGPATSTVTLSDTWATWEGDATYIGFNTATGPGDVDGDGYDDVLLSSEDTAGPDGGHGALYLVSGALSGTQSVADAEATVYSTADLGYLDFELSPIGDVDGDGLADLLAAEGDGDYGGAGWGAVLVFLSPLSGDYVATDADSTFQSDADTARFGGDAAAADFDGDGEVDLAMSRGPGVNWNADVVVYFGPISPGVHDPDLEGSGILLTSEFISGTGHVATGGDIDGDGLPDLLAPDYNDDTNGSDAGAEYLIFGSTLAGIKP